jgi:hypothetical protein
MPAGILKPCMAGARHCASCLLTLAVWTTWLLLALLLCFQAYIGTVNELQVPRFLLRAIEDHLAESGASVKFGRATFDPTGRILLQRAQFRLASFAEPIVTADAIYIRLDPIALLERKFEASEIRATGANLYIPAMFSASGRAEKLVQDLDAGFSITSRGNEFSVDYLNCRLGGVCVSAHGRINAGTVARNATPSTSLPLAEFVALNYVALSREFSGAEERMAGLDHAVLTGVLTPSDTRGAIVNAELFADGLKLAGPMPVAASGIHATCRFPLLGGAPIMTSALATAEGLHVGSSVTISGLRAWIRGILKVDTLAFDPKQLEVSAGTVSYRSTLIEAPIVRSAIEDRRNLSGEASASLFGRPVWAAGRVDLGAKSADATFAGSFAPELTEPLSAHFGHDIRRFADLSAPLVAEGSFRFLPGWKFAQSRARVDTRDFSAYGVKFSEARGLVTFDGSHFAAREAMARSGDNYAYGSYEQNFSTREFRYLLSGRLRPLDISPWFMGGWWTNTFKSFEFPVRPPEATIDVRGRYVRGASFSVFGYADSKDPVIRGVAFDAARVLLYVDPAACDGIDIFVAKGSGSAQGSFKLALDPDKGGLWSSLDVDARLRLDPAPFGKLLPQDGAQSIAAFSFDKPPSVNVDGHFDGPAAAGGRHKELHTEVRADAGLRVHGVAFDRAFFKIDIKDDNIDVNDVNAGFAGGSLSGSAQVTGTGPGKRLRFKASLAEASLGQAAEAAKGYVVSGKQGATTALDTFARAKSGVRLDLNASAEGTPGELGTFSGDGNVQVRGANLGELELLGGLSKVLKFPELRFTQAKAAFKIENGSISFPDVSIVGANSMIRGKGTYAIDRRQLDFSANIYPFMESKSLLQLFNAISAPISAVFRVRLTGSIDKPSWRLAYSPLNLLRENELKEGPADRAGSPTPLANPVP